MGSDEQESQNAAVARHVQSYLGELSQSAATAQCQRLFNETLMEFSAEAPELVRAVKLEVVEPDIDRPSYVLVTNGMSHRPMRVPREVQGTDPELYRFAELLLMLPSSWPMNEGALGQPAQAWPIQLLARLAVFPHAKNTWLGSGHTVPNGAPPAPYAETTELCGALVAPAFEVDEGFKQLRLKAAKRGPRGEYEPGVLVQFYAVIPVFADELALKLEHGAEELLDRLETAQVTETLSERRKSVARKRRFWFF